MLSILLRLRLRCVKFTIRSYKPALRFTRFAIANFHNNQRSLQNDRPNLQSSLPREQSPGKEEYEKEAKDLFSSLKKDAEARRDPQIWNQLTLLMKSSGSDRGIEVVWKAFAGYPINEVPVLYDLDMWKDLSGYELVGYIRKLNGAGIKAPVGTLKKIGLEYHSASFLLPTSDELLEAATEFLDVELPDHVYDTLMPKLCLRNNYKLALAWHRKLVAKDDRPRNMEHVEGLRQMLFRERQWAAALEVKRDIKLDTIAIRPLQDESTYTATSTILDEKDKHSALQAFVSKLDESVGVSQFTPAMNDYTCARFLATKFFSVEFVMEGLSLFGINQIGPLATREVAKRSIRGQHCDSGLLRLYFAKMKRLGMTFGTRYGRLLEHLANSSKDVLIYSIVTSEEHPDVYDDPEYQEKMLWSSDPLIIERTREVLSFETDDYEMRNILLRAGLEDIEGMIADDIPITRKTRNALIENVYIDEAPWISESKVRILVRVFARLSYVSVTEWRGLIRTFFYLYRQHLRKDLEALLLSLKDPEIFDFRTVASIIRWYMRLGSLTDTTGMETMLGGIRILAALRDLGLVGDIHLACEANLVSLFGETPISEKVDRRKRMKAQSIGSFEDFVIAIREIYDPNMWPGMTPTEVKENASNIALEMQLMKIANRQESEEEPLAPHNQNYNPGKVWHMRRKIREEEASTRNSFNDLERNDLTRIKK